MAGADRIALTDQIAAMDLIALGRFALLPEDDLNLAALLRSPLCGLGEEERFSLCPRARRHAVAASSGAGKARPSPPREIFSPTCCARADYAPPFEFYSHALVARAKARGLWRGSGEVSEAIDEFLALALA